MPHNPLTALLKKVLKDAAKQDPSATSDSLSDSRRNFIKQGTIAAGGSLLLPSFLKALPNEIKPPVIAIVGAGVAGLNAAYQLKKAGFNATVYEASARTGGRMFTLEDVFGTNITTDIGGEYVDTTHAEILTLAKELGLSFYDLREDKLSAQTFFFDGQLLLEDDLREAIKPFAKLIEADVLSLPKQINNSTAANFRKFDDISITAYISKLGITGWLFHFLEVVLTREYGMEASEQSAMNFLVMFKEPMPADKSYELFGDAHEALKIKGGSQQLTNALAKKVEAQIVFNYRLTAVANRRAGYTLTFSTRGKQKQVNADYVIIAIPFTILRTIDVKVDMPIEKRRCIDELGYGNSGKFILGFNTKTWRTAGQKGYTFSDLDFGCGWDSSLMQSKEEGSFTVFGGGNFMNENCDLTPQETALRFVPQINVIYPGSIVAYNRKTMNFCWGKNANSQGGYSAFKVGQWSTLAGWEQMPVENLYFAGEHTSLEFQGYMNGAAQTGREAAEMVSKAIALAMPPAPGPAADSSLLKTDSLR